MQRTPCQFDYSVGIQTKSPKKAYLIDNAIIHKIGFNATENLGNTLENAIAVELMRRHQEIYYYAGKQECDFILRKGTTITQAIQVTVSLQNEQTREREIKGLLEAMEQFKLQEGIIITLNENEEFPEENGRRIKALPAWRWFLE